MEKPQNLAGSLRSITSEGGAWLGVLVSTLSGFSVISKAQEIGLSGIVAIIQAEYRKIIAPVHDVLSSLFPIDFLEWQLDCIIFYTILTSLCIRLMFSSYVADAALKKSTQIYEDLFVFRAHNEPEPSFLKVLPLYPIMVKFLIPLILSLMLWPIWSFYVFRRLVIEYAKNKPEDRFGMPLTEWAKKYRTDINDLRARVQDQEKTEHLKRRELIISGARFYLVPILIALLFTWNAIEISITP